LSTDTKNEKAKKKILIIDDDRTVCEVHGDILRAFGYESEIAFNGVEGWKKYNEISPDLITLDIVMPGMDGLELLQRIRQKDKSTPVVIISAMDSFDNFWGAITLGANEFLAKPITLDELRDVVDDYLNDLPRRRIYYGETVAKKFFYYMANVRRRSNMSRSSEEIDSSRENYRAICGAVAHGIKGELGVIAAIFQELEKTENVSSELIREAEIIRRSVKYSEILLRKLVTYLELDTAHFTLVSISNLLQEVQTLILPRIPSEIEFEIAIDSQRGLFAYSNFEHLMLIIIELINNSINELREKGGCIKVNAQLRKGKVAIIVKDNGLGISPDLKKKLLKEPVPSKRGLGLALYFSNKVLNALGGELQLDSSNRGTAITILLPQANEKNT